MRRFNAQSLAEPHSCRHRIRGATVVALHGINWRQPELLTVVAYAFWVVRQVLLQIAAQIFGCDRHAPVACFSLVGCGTGTQSSSRVSATALTLPKKSSPTARALPFGLGRVCPLAATAASFATVRGAYLIS